ncbi:hypothetical protein GCM10028796_22580 [Ramlibacter monticola]|uniref:Uncharacterized protein n=1 Tax=Ramlibacter monticola TaxID=1926872 RepID=A0A936YZV1_9BURK|nr:hypothetical protein [Ramlibacter monticola]MBL0392510.1 hypothetical protein [Ramlibacter monticola]
MTQTSDIEFQLCFRNLYHGGRGFAFPCDAEGRVDLNHMSERARNNYLYARAMIGREVAHACVENRRFGPIHRPS